MAQSWLHSLLILFGSFAVANLVVVKKNHVIDTAPVNITVVTGHTATLPCTVDPRYTEDNDQYKTLWSNPQGTAVSIQDRRILSDVRISVERPRLRDWNLHIRNVSLTDAGVYKCQINTRPVGTKHVRLIVKEPPSIIDHTQPTDIERPEGETVELFCNATGTPEPEITWYRLNKRSNRQREHLGQSGEVLVIHNISRICADTYECVADNNVPSATSQSFKITIQYPPEVHLPNTRIGQFLGKDTILECEVNAVPLGSVSWRHNGREVTNPRHEINLYQNMDDSVILSLRLQKISREDFGEYQCNAENEQGLSTRTMVLYEIPPKRTSSTTTSTTPAPRHWGSSSRQEILAVDQSARANSLQGSGGDGGEHGINRWQVPNRQNGNHYRPRVNSQDGAPLRSEAGGRNYGPTDGSSKYTGVIANDGNNRNGNPHLKFDLSVVTVCAALAMAGVTRLAS